MKNIDVNIRRIRIWISALFAVALVSVYSHSAYACDLTAQYSYQTPCTANTIYFTDLSSSTSPIQTWHWSFGDGSADAYYKHPSHIFPSGGIYNVTLIVTDQSGCNDTVINTVTVPYVPIAAISSDTVVCQGSPIQFTNLTDSNSANITGWLWVTGDGFTSPSKNLIHTYSAGGTYTVDLKVYYGGGCYTSTTQTIVVPSLIPDFSFSLECSGDTVQFDCASVISTGSIQDWIWNFGDGSALSSGASSVSHTYASTTTAASYSASLQITDNNGCTASIIKSVNVLPLPEALISVSQNCANTPTSFISQSTSQNGNIVMWNWDFGDAGSGNTASCSHTYASTGASPDTFYVSLEITDVAGCVDTAETLAIIHPAPVPVFSFSQACMGDTTYFTDASLSPNSSIVGWEWIFDGYNTSNLQNPSFVYSSPGAHLPQLTVTDANGCSTTMVDSLWINSVPMPGLDFSLNCFNNVVQFSDTTNYPTPVTAWNWNFGDNNYSTSINPVHYYSSTGSYNVELSVVDANGCRGYASKIVNLTPPVVVDFVPFKICQGDTANLNAQVLSGTTPIVSWVWDLGTGASCIGQNVNPHFANPGTFLISLIATDSNGCISLVTHPAIVVANPNAQFSGNTVFFGDESNFVDQSQSTANPIKTRYLDFGDGSAPVSVTQDTTLYIYPSPGFFEATLFVADSLGCDDTAKEMMMVYSNFVKADWIADTVCSGKLTQFIDQSMVGSGDVVSWTWKFGDNAVSYLQNPVHSYDTAGIYQVVLIITTDLGITDSAKASVLVFDSPIAEFDYSTTCEEDKKVFYNFSSIPSGSGIVAYQWNLGNGNGSSLSEPEYAYNNAGSYEITLIVNSDQGCIDSVTHTLIVGFKPKMSFGANKYMGCDQANIEFRDSSTISDGHIESWYWDFGDGSHTTDPIIAKHTYNNIGSYNVMLTLVTDLGCSSTKMIPSMIHVHPKPVADFDFHPGDADIHRPTVYFHNNSIGGDKYEWKFGDGHSTTVFEPVHNFVYPGDYTITLKTETEFGCTDYKYRDIKVKSEPVFFVPNAFTPNGDGLNDFFQPVGTAYSEEGAVRFVFQVFDRTGSLVFDSPGDMRPWDGSIKGGNLAPEGVYVCRIVQQDPDGKQYTHVGQVTLMR